jgi:zinc transport system substrate-binding protein
MRKGLLLTLIISILLACQLSFVNAADKVQVVVSIPPQTYFVEQIGGDLVNVMSMVPEGGFPHTYEPTPEQMKLLSKADMYVRIKVEFENAWWNKILAANPNMHVVDSTKGIDFIEEHAPHYHEEEREHQEGEKHHEHEGEHHKHEGEHHEHEREAHMQHGRDPHTWLSPRMVKIQTEAICEGLIYVDPENRETYTANKKIFLKALDGLDQDIREMFANLKTRKFMVFHPSWAYFARDYNLEQISIEIEGKEPSAVEMTTLMKTAQAEKIRVIFVQPQTSKRSAEIIAKQIGAKVKILDTLAKNWMENMRVVTETLVEALNKD